MSFASQQGVLVRSCFLLLDIDYSRTLDWQSARNEVSPEWLRQCLSLQVSMGLLKNAPENIMFMYDTIQLSFDRQEWCVLVQPDGSGKVRLQGANA